MYLFPRCLTLCPLHYCLRGWVAHLCGFVLCTVLTGCWFLCYSVCAFLPRCIYQLYAVLWPFYTTTWVRFLLVDRNMVLVHCSLDLLSVCCISSLGALLSVFRCSVKWYLCICSSISLPPGVGIWPLGLPASGVAGLWLVVVPLCLNSCL